MRNRQQSSLVWDLAFSPSRVWNTRRLTRDSSTPPSHVQLPSGPTPTRPGSRRPSRAPAFRDPLAQASIQGDGQSCPTVGSKRRQGTVGPTFGNGGRPCLRTQTDPHGAVQAAGDNTDTSAETSRPGDLTDRFAARHGDRWTYGFSSSLSCRFVVLVVCFIASLIAFNTAADVGTAMGAITGTVGCHWSAHSSAFSLRKRRERQPARSQEG